MPTTTFLAISATIVALAVSACGGSSSSTSSTASPTSSTAATSTAPPSSGQTASALSIAADPNGQLRFTKSALTAKAGKLAIRFTNNASLAHNLTIASHGTVLGATPTFQGGTKTLTLNLKPGTYTFYCSVPRHREGGMQGTLTVR